MPQNAQSAAGRALQLLRRRARSRSILRRDRRTDHRSFGGLPLRRHWGASNSMRKSP